MRTEIIVKKEASDAKMPLKGKKLLTRSELDEIVMRLAESHGMIQ